MTTAQVIETSVTNNNSPIHDYFHPDDHSQPSHEMTPGFKPFTMIITLMTMTMNKVRIKTKYKDLSEIVEAAKRIERSFSPSHSQPNKQSPEQTNALTTNPAPGFPRGRGKGPRCYSCNFYGHTKGNCPEKSQKTTFLRIPKEVTKFAVYGTNINDLSASY